MLVNQSNKIKMEEKDNLDEEIKAVLMKIREYFKQLDLKNLAYLQRFLAEAIYEKSKGDSIS